MLQIAVPDDAVDTSLEIEIEGDVTINRDEAEIRKGLAELNRLDSSYNIPQFSQIVNDGGTTVLSWRRVY